MREVVAADAIEFLKNAPPFEKASLVASMPDISEFPGMKLPEWTEWFSSTAELILSKCPPGGVVIFFQSDIRLEGEWVDKGYICSRAAERQGMKTLWHKMVCRVPAGQPSFGRPGYSHILCFTRDVKLDLAKSTADVIVETGDKTWVRGMGINVCLSLVRFIKEQVGSELLVHPFCGEGSMLAAANHVGLKALGIERSVRRAAAARRLSLSQDGTSWVE